jgi:hypothetical protein
MNKLSKLTCTPEESHRLVQLGILQYAFLWHERGPEGEWDTRQMAAPLVGTDFVFPAWTKAELDVMIGPRFAKPDLWTQELRPKSATHPHTYPIRLPDRELVFRIGARASATALIYMLTESFLSPDDCNQRYKDVFLTETL